MTTGFTDIFSIATLNQPLMNTFYLLFELHSE